MKRWQFLLALLLCAAAAFFIYRFVVDDEGVGLMPNENVEPFPDEVRGKEKSNRAIACLSEYLKRKTS